MASIGEVVELLKATGAPAALSIVMGYAANMLVKTRSKSSSEQTSDPRTERNWCEEEVTWLRHQLEQKDRS